MYLTSEILARLESLGIAPKKSLGQNFLVSQNTIDKILKAAEGFDAEQLIEVGPGLGSLTEGLLKLGLPLSLLELDRMFAQYWRDRGQRVIEGDALQWNWNQIVDPQSTLLVSNLPYQISSSLVIDRSLSATPLMGMVLMFQKEVAERITAKPKTDSYGLLSVMAQNFWNVEVVAEAGPKDFYPPPRVASRVLKFTPKKDFTGKPLDFLKLVKAGFSHRRKYLLSNLKSLGNITAEPWRGIFEALPLSLQGRAEELNLKQWRDLYAAMSAAVAAADATETVAETEAETEKKMKKEIKKESEKKGVRG